MGCSPSKVQDGAAPISHPVVKPAVQPVQAQSPAATVPAQAQGVSDIKDQFGNTADENEAACKVQSVYRGHAARKRVEGLKSEKESQVFPADLGDPRGECNPGSLQVIGGSDKDVVACAIPEVKPAVNPICNPDDSAAAVVQVFGEEGANAVAAAFFDGNAAIDSGDAAPDQDTTKDVDVQPQPVDAVEPAQESAEPSAPEDTPAPEEFDAPEQLAPQEEPAVPLESKEMQDVVADEANVAAMDATAPGEPGSPEDNATLTGTPVCEDAAAPSADAETGAAGLPEDSEGAAAPEELLENENAASPAEAPEAEESPQPEAAGAAADATELSDVPEPEQAPMTVEETPAGGEVANPEPSPENETNATELVVDLATEELPAPNDDPATQAEVGDEEGGLSSVEPVGEPEVGTEEV